MKGIELNVYFNPSEVKNSVAFRACQERGVAPHLSRLTILAGTFCSHSHTHTHTQRCPVHLNICSFFCTLPNIATDMLTFNPLNPELNPIPYLLALLGAHHFLHVSRIRVKSLTLRQLMSYIWSTYS